MRSNCMHLCNLRGATPTKHSSGTAQQYLALVRVNAHQLLLVSGVQLRSGRTLELLVAFVRKDEYSLD